MRCAYHKYREPVGACVNCGKLICSECIVSLEGKVYCNSCVEAAHFRSKIEELQEDPLSSEYKKFLPDVQLLRKHMPKLSLMGYLGTIPFSKMVEKSLFKSPTIKFSNFLLVSSYLYEVGAIIGKSYSNKLLILWKMFDIEHDKEKESIEHFQEQARKRIDSYGKVPESFLDFFWTTELSKINLSFDLSPKLINALEEKIPVEQVELMVKMFGIEGIGFGSKYPDLTTKMLKYQYDFDHSETRFEMILHGSSVLPKSPITSRQKENEVENQLKAYVCEYFPDVMAKLFNH